MPVAKVVPGLSMHYYADDYTDPWRKPETVMLLHGNAESGAVWYGWVPTLSRHYRVLRPDMRGFGGSTVMQKTYSWTLDVLADDYAGLMKELGIDRVHLVGAKLGGTVARRFAARYPERVSTLSLVGSPPPFRDMIPMAKAMTDEYEQHGIEHWARRTMSSRLGKDFPPEGVEWWIKLMGRTAVSTDVGFVRDITRTNITDDLPKITCPTLVITTEGSALGSVDEMKIWQKKIPNSTLLALPGDSFHIAATDPERCARETLAFMQRSSRR